MLQGTTPGYASFNRDALVCFLIRWVEAAASGFQQGIFANHISYRTFHWD
jgi:hypothetical protein